MGRSPAYEGGSAINPPIVRASTVVFENTHQQREMRARRGQERIFSYGARGTPTSFALEDAVSELEGAYRTRLLPTGSPQQAWPCSATSSRAITSSSLTVPISLCGT